jgi:hypothetical protein
MPFYEPPIMLLRETRLEFFVHSVYYTVPPRFLQSLFLLLF